MSTLATEAVKLINGIEKSEIREILESDGKIRAIARKLGINPGHVYRYKRYGIEPKRADLRLAMGLSETESIDLPPHRVLICKFCKQPTIKYNNQQRACWRRECKLKLRRSK